jgi:hypothetical protein
MAFDRLIRHGSRRNAERQLEYDGSPFAPKSWPGCAGEVLELRE